LKIEFDFGILGHSNIGDYDAIYSPSIPIDTSQHPNKKFIFGPHFSVFPNSILQIINNVCNNSVYIQPSQWAVDVWKMKGVDCNKLPLEPFPFPVDTNTFSPINKENKTKVLIYFKRRKQTELQFLKDQLKSRDISFTIFDYCKRYEERDYIKCLQESKYGIILDAHESQGFAVEEAMSCDVPLLVWNTTVMSQEVGSTYTNEPCTSIPYFNEKCGEYFYNQDEFESTFELFLKNLDEYNPRKYILDNLSVGVCAKRLETILKLN